MAAVSFPCAELVDRGISQPVLQPDTAGIAGVETEVGAYAVVNLSIAYRESGV